MPTDVTERFLPDFRETITNLEEMLRALGIGLEPGNAIEEAFLALELLDLREKGTAKLDREDQVTAIRRSIGVLTFIDQVLFLRNTPFIKIATPHLRLLAKRGAVVAQSSEHRSTDHHTKKLFELLMGMMAYRLTGNVELEDPEAGKASKNPDVITTHESVRWGIACKALSGRNPQTWFDRIKEGIHQIAKSGVDRGIVAINPAAIFPYNEYIPHITDSGEHRGVFSSVRDAMEHSIDWFEAQRVMLSNLIEPANGPGMDLWPGIGAPFDVPACLFYIAIPAVIRLEADRTAWQFAATFVRWYPHSTTLDAGASRFLSGLAANSGLQKIRRLGS